MASLMLDRVIEAHIAGGYTPRIEPTIFHLTNILLHSICSGLVFLLLQRLTGSPWVSVAFAMLFAVHPLNVEVVSWICQRKALLSMLFALLTMLAYLRYVTDRRTRWLFLATAAFGLSMLSKPTAVFRAVLLLLDHWPLRRWSREAIIEKWPLVVVALIGGWIAYVSQTSTVDMTDEGHHRGFFLTALIACHNFAFYAAKILLPIRLCPLYIAPPENEMTLLNVPFAAGLAITLTLAVGLLIAYRRGDRAVWTMPLAFLFLIGPTLGPVRFSNTIAADRFVSLPMTAALVLLAELVRRLSGSLRRTLIPVGILAILVFAVHTWRQQAVWNNNVAFYSAVIDRFPHELPGHYGLGNAYLDLYDRSKGPHSAVTDEQRSTWLDQALAAYRTTLSIQPDADDSVISQAYYRIGHIQILQGRTTEGIETMKTGLRQSRAHPMGYCFLGMAYGYLGAYAEAIGPYEACLQYRPTWTDIQRDLANALLRTGRAADAILHYERLYELNPTDLDGLQNWAVALLTVGDAKAAVQRLRAVIEIRTALVAKEPGSSQQTSNLADAYYTLAGALAMNGDADGAIENLRQAVRLKPEILKQAETNRAFASLKQTPRWKFLGDTKGP